MTLPILVLVVFGTIDLGRAFFQSIVVENAVKEGAFFGSRTPECDTHAAGACADPNNVEARVIAELDDMPVNSFEAKCFAAGTVDFTGPGKSLDDCEDGDIYYVRAVTPFTTVVPFIGDLVGGTLSLQAHASAVVVSSFSEVDGSLVPIPTTEPSASTAPGICTVPDFTVGPTQIGDAEDVWVDFAGFLGANLTTNGGNGQNITWQSVPPGTHGSCNTQEIIVSATAMATPTPTATPSPTPSPSGSPAATPTGAATPTPTPEAMCTVPNMRNDRVTVAQGEWSANGFSAANFTATRPPNDDYRVGSQSIAHNSVRPCLTTTITVSD